MAGQARPAPVPGRDGSTYPTRLRILSLNCWGLKYLATFRRERLAEIARLLAAHPDPPHIVGLQECWTQEDYNVIRTAVADFLPYSKFYFSGIFGGGLAILSAFPIIESSMHAYPLNGRPTAFFRGDWFVGKGVACARVKLGPGELDVAEVFCTHLHAPYEQEPNDSYICHRTAQAWEIAKLMRGAAERGHLVVACGDFNMVPLSFAHRLIEGHAPVKDVWRIAHPESSTGAADDAWERKRLESLGMRTPNAQYNVEYNGTTCDSAYNTWRWPKDDQKKLGEYKHGELRTQEDINEVDDPKAKRLDYVFVSDRDQLSRGAKSWRVAEANVGMTSRHPVLKCSLSDHFSIETTLLLDEYNTHSTSTYSPPPALEAEIYDRIQDMIESYKARERWQRKARLWHFGVGLIVSIACLVAVWWSPRNYVAFILMLVSTLSLSTGVIDGLIGGLFVSAELRALKEFQWEISTAQQMAKESTRADSA
ncbi:hypothetical protein FH972_023128 [Carpinus fangiana]|uniref:Endonuclease/exonuclease/phosphatase domain-containing protein n=1 Tax=Carpinus fangiana TaxID=176857 RepID=A0A5N6KUP9_9ROSI|nr:hypothetical protein FH972_023128 [Carpinus fangiana]